MRLLFSLALVLFLFVSFSSASYGNTPQADYWNKTDLVRYKDDIVVYLYVEQDVFAIDNSTNSTDPVRVPIETNKAVFYPKVDIFSSLSVPGSMYRNFLLKLYRLTYIYSWASIY